MSDRVRPHRTRTGDSARLAVAACLAAVIGSTLLLGCGTDGGGHLYLALNQSDRDVIVEVVTDDRSVFRLPAHTRGHLSNTWASAIEGWRITVLDEGCAEIAAFDLHDQPWEVTLYVAAAGEVTVGSGTLFSFEGKRVELLSPLPAASCG